MQSAARALATAGPSVAVKDGSRGALVVAAGGHEAAEVLAEPTPVVDTIGAGDKFDAGFLAAILDGATLWEARAVSERDRCRCPDAAGTGRHADRDEACAQAERLTVRAIADPSGSPSVEERV